VACFESAAGLFSASAAKPPACYLFPGLVPLQNWMVLAIAIVILSVVISAWWGRRQRRSSKATRRKWANPVFPGG